MNERIILISLFDNKRITYLLDDIKEELCKVPFGRKLDDRAKVDKLPYHFTLSSWDVKKEDVILNKLSKLKFNNLSATVNGLSIMNGKEKSYVLCFDVVPNYSLKKLQEKIYNILPNEFYNPETFKFHITITIDKDYEKILRIKSKIEEKFIPFELEVNNLRLFTIYPAKLVKTFELGDE